MKKYKSNYAIVSEQSARFFASVVMLIGLLFLIGWYGNLMVLINYPINGVVLAASTACGFIFMAAGLWFYLRPQKSASNHNLAMVAVAIVLCLSSFFFLTNLLKYYPEWEHAFIKIPETQLCMQVAHMSLVTASLFLISGFALLFLLSNRKIVKTFSVILALIVFTTSLTLLLGYGFGVPFFYFDNFIPPAFFTVLSFLLVSLGLIMASDKNTFLVKFIRKTSTSGKLLRIFLPTTIAITLIEGLIVIRILPHLNIHTAIGVTLISIIFVAVVIVVISIISKRLGTSFDASLEKLNESETRFRIFMNANTDLTFIKDDHFRYLFANEQTALFFNRTIDELIGKTDEELTVQTQIFPCQSSDKRALESKEQFTLQEQLGDRIFEVTKVPLQLSNNKKGIGGIMKDITERKQAEDKTRAVEENLKNTFDLSPSIICKGNINTGYFTEANQAVIRMLGYTVEEFISKPFVEFVHPDDRQNTIDEMLALQKGKEMAFFENRYLCKNGSYKWLAWHGAKVDENGIVRAIAADITEYKLAQLELHQSNQLLETSQVIAKLGGWELDIATNNLFWTAETYRIHDTSPEVFNPTVDAGVGYFLPESRRKITDALKVAIEDGKGYDLVLETLTTKGRRIDIRTTCEVTLHNGKPTRLTGIFQDITEQKEIELALVKSEAKQSEMISNISDVIAILNPQGVITYKSPNIKNLFGWSSEELIGKSGFINIHEDDKEHVQKEFANLIENKKANTAIEFKYKCMDGTYKMVHCTASNLMKNPHINGVLLNFHDISLQKETELSLKKSEEQLRIITNNLPILISHIDKNLKYLFANQYYYDIGAFGNEIIGANVMDVIGEKAFNRAFPHMQKALSGEFARFENRSTNTKNNELVILETQFIPYMVNDQIESFFVLAVDITKRKLAEEKIRAAEENLKNTFDISPSIICKANVETGYFIEVNQAVTRILGYAIEEFKSKPFEEFMHPDDRQRTVNEILEQRNGPKTTSFQNRYLCKDGSYKWMAWHTTKADENGIVTAIASDISKRKIIEQEIVETKQFYENIIEGVQDGIWVTDKNDVLFYTNLAMEKIAGVPKEQILGNNILKDFPEDVIGEFRKFYMQAKKEKKPVWYDIKAKTLSNKEASQNGWLIPQYQNKAFNGVICTVRDVTQRKEAEGSVRKLSTAVKQSPSMVAITDTEGILEYVNPKFTELTGYSIAEAIGKTSNILKSGEQDSLFYKELWKTVESGEVWRGQFRNKKKNGELFWEAASISAILNESGDVINYIKIGEDITLQKNTEAELKIALEKALESDRLKSAFLSNMSHEIRTPMNGILGFINLLNEPNLNKSQISTYSAIINKSGDRLLNTINDIIDISKIEAGEVVVSNVETCIKTEVEELYAFFLPEANSKGLSLFVEPSETEELRIITDSNKIHGVLTNLLKNAIKFTEKGTITFGYLLKENFIEFFVQDTGFGIPKNRIHAIFNRFEQADIEDVRVLEGSGLGLAIAKAYVTMLGGEISVESVEGKGSKFVFTIPFIQNAIKQIEQLPENGKNNTSRIENLNLLVVEDDKVSSELLEMLLIDTFPNITFAQNGKEAVEICKNNLEIDLVLMDLKMPVMDGYTATQQIRAFNKDLIIIAQTAYVMHGDREKAIEVGCNEYITKPINKILLLEMINMLID